MAIPERIIEIVDLRLLIPSTIDEQERRRVRRQQNMEENLSEECVASFARIGVACSQEIANERMSIKDVISELHAIKQAMLLITSIVNCDDNSQQQHTFS
ncbi:hypothetical protein PIB30_017378 [Stylosanthes scabra]|uniref:Uncharacterized protein n=1 Tax=Stylosanthes scabra TaxID=79078 RepID=A0ABU6V5T0_9FABA|nr:hypothetical protein [Stylosanthes scabra]